MSRYGRHARLERSKMLLYAQQRRTQFPRSIEPKDTTESDSKSATSNLMAFASEAIASGLKTIDDGFNILQQQISKSPTSVTAQGSDESGDNATASPHLLTPPETEHPSKGRVGNVKTTSKKNKQRKQRHRRSNSSESQYKQVRRKKKAVIKKLKMNSNNDNPILSALGSINFWAEERDAKQYAGHKSSFARHLLQTKVFLKNGAPNQECSSVDDANKSDAYLDLNRNSFIGDILVGEDEESSDSEYESKSEDKRTSLEKSEHDAKYGEPHPHGDIDGNADTELESKGQPRRAFSRTFQSRAYNFGGKNESHPRKVLVLGEPLDANSNTIGKIEHSLNQLCEEVPVESLVGVLEELRHVTLNVSKIDTKDSSFQDRLANQKHALDYLQLIGFDHHEQNLFLKSGSKSTLIAGYGLIIRASAAIQKIAVRSHKRPRVRPGRKGRAPLSQVYADVATISKGPYRCVCVGQRDFIFLLSEDHNTMHILAPKARGQVTLRGEKLIFVKCMVWHEDRILLSDHGMNCIFKLDIATGIVDIFVGCPGERGYLDGIGLKARFNGPWQMSVDKQTNTIYVADVRNLRIRSISADGHVRTVAGTGHKGHRDGAFNKASFKYPCGIASLGNGILFVSEMNDIRVIDLTEQPTTVTTLCGSELHGFVDGDANDARFNVPRHLAVGSCGCLYIADRYNNCIRKVSHNGSEVSTVAGNGKDQVVDGFGKRAAFKYIYAMSIDNYGHSLYVIDGDGSLREVCMQE